MHPVDTKEIFIFKNLFKGNRKLYRKGPIFPQNENYSKTNLENNIFFSSSSGTSVALRSKKKVLLPTLLAHSLPTPPWKTRSVPLRASVYWDGFSWTCEKNERFIMEKTNKNHFLKREEILWGIGLKSLFWLYGTVSSQTSIPGRRVKACGLWWPCSSKPLEYSASSTFCFSGYVSIPSFPPPHSQPYLLQVTLGK